MNYAGETIYRCQGCGTLLLRRELVGVHRDVWEPHQQAMDEADRLPPEEQ